MAFNFNTRGIGVVDYHSGSRSYAVKKRTGEAPGTLEQSAIKKTKEMLKILLIGDPIVTDIDILLEKLKGKFFLIYVNAKMLALAIYHLYINDFYSFGDREAYKNENFYFHRDMFYSDKLVTAIEIVKNSYTKKSNRNDDDDYSHDKFSDKTKITIFRYERFILKSLES